MSLTPTEVDFVEHIVQEQDRYQSISTEQFEVLRTDPDKSRQAKAQIEESPFFAKPSQLAQPAQDKVDEYLAECNDICRSVPCNFEDRVKIMYAAQAALSCLSNCKIALQPEGVMSAIRRRHYEISQLSLRPPTPPITTQSSWEPLSEPSVDPRPITTEELRLFQIPDNLHGKKFFLSPDGAREDETCMYEIIAYTRKRDKTVVYEVLWDECHSPILTGEDELMRLLDDSLYFPA